MNVESFETGCELDIICLAKEIPSPDNLEG